MTGKAVILVFVFEHRLLEIFQIMYTRASVVIKRLCVHSNSKVVESTSRKRGQTSYRANDDATIKLTGFKQALVYYMRMIRSKDVQCLWENKKTISRLFFFCGFVADFLKPPISKCPISNTLKNVSSC